MSTSTRTPAPSPPRSGRRWLRWWMVLLVFPAIFVGVVGVLFAFYVFSSVPLPDDIQVGTTEVLDGDGEPIGTLSSEQARTDVRVEDLPDHVVDAVLSAEDRGFYSHRGVSVRGVARALVSNTIAGEVTQGGSTITQQYVKNALLTPERTVTRKLNEAALAIKLERAYTKDEILSFYLSTIYWGRGAYGIEAASQVYFDRPAAELDRNQAATLAGIIQSPERLDPIDNPGAADARRVYVLDGMLEQGWLEAERHPTLVSRGLPSVRTGTGLAGGPEAYYLDAVRRELGPVLGEAQLFAGLTIRTAYDPTAQAAAQDAVRAAVDEGGHDSGALVAIDPATGGVVALVGGPDFARQQLNVAVQGSQQVGSSFKPFTLTRWVQDGFSTESVFDAPTEITVGDTTFRNYGGSAYGRQTLHEATVTSTNTVYVAAQQELGGGQAVIDTALAMGLPAERDGEATMQPTAGLTLGQDQFTPLEMASAYATLAAGGTWREPHLVTEVRDRDGAVVHRAPDTTRDALNAEVAAVVSDVLVDTVSSGTGTAAALEGRPVAGKTGTTNDNRDAWFVGYTPQLAAAVWVGNLDDSPVEDLTGGGSAAPVWGAFATRALEGTEVLAFPDPDLSGLEVLRDEPAACPEGYQRGPAPSPAPDQDGEGVDGEGDAAAQRQPDVIDDGEEQPCVEVLPDPEPTPSPSPSPSPSPCPSDDQLTVDDEGCEPVDEGPDDEDGGGGEPSPSPSPSPPPSPLPSPEPEPEPDPSPAPDPTPSPTEDVAA